MTTKFATNSVVLKSMILKLGHFGYYWPTFGLGDAMSAYHFKIMAHVQSLITGLGDQSEMINVSINGNDVYITKKELWILFSVCRSNFIGFAVFPDNVKKIVIIFWGDKEVSDVISTLPSDLKNIRSDDSRLKMYKSCIEAIGSLTASSS